MRAKAARVCPQHESKCRQPASDKSTASERASEGEREGEREGGGREGKWEGGRAGRCLDEEEGSPLGDDARVELFDDDPKARHVGLEGLEVNLGVRVLGCGLRGGGLRGQSW